MAVVGLNCIAPMFLERLYRSLEKVFKFKRQKIAYF